jgi:pyrroline-5-carboxylate reductase
MTVLSTIPPSAPSANLTRQIVLSLFQPIGRCRSLDEKHFDAVTAVCGSGPAFAMLVLEAMADGGVMMGLPRAEALELAAQSGPSARPSARADSQGSHARCSKNGPSDGPPPSRHQGQRHK